MKVEEIYGKVCRLLFKDFPPTIDDFPDDFNRMPEEQQKEYITGAFTLKTSFKRVGLEKAVGAALKKFNSFQEKLDRKPKEERALFLVKYLTYLTGKLPIKSTKKEEEKEEEEEEEVVRGGGKSKKIRKTRKTNTKKKKTRRNKTRRNAKTGGSGSEIAAGVLASVATVNWGIVAVGAIVLLLLCVLLSKCHNDDADMLDLYDPERDAMVAPGLPLTRPRGDVPGTPPPRVRAGAPEPAPAPARGSAVTFSAAHSVRTF